MFIYLLDISWDALTQGCQWQGEGFGGRIPTPKEWSAGWEGHPKIYLNFLVPWHRNVSCLQ